jgi:hypothetical protein
MKRPSKTKRSRALPRYYVTASKVGGCPAGDLEFLELKSAITIRPPCHLDVIPCKYKTERDGISKTGSTQIQPFRTVRHSVDHCQTLSIPVNTLGRRSPSGLTNSRSQPKRRRLGVQLARHGKPNRKSRPHPQVSKQP